MTRIVIKKLIWDEFNLEHATVHGISLDEIKEAVNQIKYHRITYKQRYLVVCKGTKRFITIIVVRKSLSTYYIVSARPASKKEIKNI